MLNKRPYVVINGVNSQSIPGLLIEELPPITKAPQRLQTETVDGRDGDIITPLGFNAYDKTIKIGLSRGYNVNDVIQFFCSSGKIIFSNEPDKYYLFSQYGQIDFTRLIRFREANIILHVQPFKFADNESTKTFWFDDQTPKTFNIRNNGNYFSRPTLEINGTGNVYISLNGAEILGVELSLQNPTVIINAAEMNASAPDGTFLNRKVTGNYDNIKLKVGENKIDFTGAVSSIKIKDFSRWI